MFIHVHLPNFQCKSLSGDDLPLGLKLIFSCLSLEGLPKSKANVVFNGLLQHFLKQVFRGDTYLDLVFGCEISALRSMFLKLRRLNNSDPTGGFRYWSTSKMMDSNNLHHLIKIQPNHCQTIRLEASEDVRVFQVACIQ